MSIKQPGIKYAPPQVPIGQAPLCLRCGYSLRGAINSRCPECGARDGGFARSTFEERVYRSELYLALCSTRRMMSLLLLAGAPGGSGFWAAFHTRGDTSLAARRTFRNWAVSLIIILCSSVVANSIEVRHVGTMHIARADETRAFGSTFGPAAFSLSSRYIPLKPQLSFTLSGPLELNARRGVADRPYEEQFTGITSSIRVTNPPRHAMLGALLMLWCTLLWAIPAAWLLFSSRTNVLAKRRSIRNVVLLLSRIMVVTAVAYALSLPIDLAARLLFPVSERAALPCILLALRLLPVLVAVSCWYSAVRIDNADRVHENPLLRWAFLPLAVIFAPASISIAVANVLGVNLY